MWKRFYQSVNNREGRFEGFVLGRDKEECKEKAELIECKVFGVMIKR